MHLKPLETMKTKCDSCASSSQSEIWTKEGYQLVRCDGCGLIFVANPPSAEQLEKLYSFANGYHQGLAQCDAEILRHEGEARANMHILSKHARPGLLLDIGCSTGLFLLEAQRSGWNVCGLEYSPDSAKIAHVTHHLEVAQGALTKGRYPANSFDVVTMWDVIEHLPSPSAALDVVMDILKPGGLFIAKTPNVDGLYPALSLHVAGKVGYWGHPEPPGHLYQFSVTTLGKLLIQKGFAIEHVHHQMIPIAYSFGTFKEWCRSLKWFAYSCIFAPTVILGRLVNRGDTVIIVAQKNVARFDAITSACLTR
jgi:2-polyprenyl-3-methyl-5-hydroxy-6-metoxy-1,4-benzoquinol methylase